MDRKSNDYIGNFSIIDNDEISIDGVQESDGAAVTHLNLGGEFTNGLLVVQDGENTPYIFDEDNRAIDNANFKYTPWELIADEMGLVVREE
jgi:3-phytase